jgi:hypothetical protein
MKFNSASLPPGDAITVAVAHKVITLKKVGTALLLEHLAPQPNNKMSL